MKSKTLKPKPLLASTHHYYRKADGTRWITTAEPGAPLEPGAKWEKETHYEFEVFAGSRGGDGPFAICGSVDKLTPEKAKRIAQWWTEVAKWLEARK